MSKWTHSLDIMGWLIVLRVEQVYLYQQTRVNLSLQEIQASPAVWTLKTRNLLGHVS